MLNIALDTISEAAESFQPWHGNDESKEVINNRV